MESTELEMERMEIIRAVMETDSWELLQELKVVLAAWKAKRADVDFESPSLQYTVEELKQKIALSEAGKGTPGSVFFETMKRKYPELCK